MNLHQKFTTLMFGITLVLSIATMVGTFLRVKAAGGPSMAVIDNLNARIKSWWLMVAIFAGAFMLGRAATLIMFACASLLALREFITITPTRASDHSALAIAFFVLIPVQYVLIGVHDYEVFAIFIPVFAFVVLPSLTVAGADTENFINRSAKIQWGVMLTVYCVSHAPALLLLDIPGYQNQDALLLFYLVMVVQSSDVLQYIFGKLFGRTKIAAVVSPSKTVEGFIGGGAAAVALGTGMYWITPFSPLEAMAMSCLIVISGFVGGLVLSAVKRDLGAKDWGSLIKGHGGALDRLDSICFSAPVFFHLTRHFFA